MNLPAPSKQAFGRGALVPQPLRLARLRMIDISMQNIRPGINQERVQPSVTLVSGYMDHGMTLASASL
jgi:hypothetical protein